ncbi:hypothetical protein SLA2020_014510 [Shorea laevis]
MGEGQMNGRRSLHAAARLRHRAIWSFTFFLSLFSTVARDFRSRRSLNSVTLSLGVRGEEGVQDFAPFGPIILDQLQKINIPLARFSPIILLDSSKS